MKTKTMFAAAAIAVIASTAAQAATEQFNATSAVGSGADHSLWISGGIAGGLGSDFDFDPAGLFTIDENDVGSLTGRVVSQSAGFSDTGFEVNFTYVQPAFAPQFKSENSSAGAADLRFTYLEGGTLTGFGQLQDVILNVVAKPQNDTYAAQWGSAPDDLTVGPNNKNSNFGMAHWFTIDSIGGMCFTDFCDQYRSSIRGLVGTQGDINVDLAPIPLPAGGVLLLTGLAAAAGLRRRKT
jgi:hypothetical protein